MSEEKRPAAVQIKGIKEGLLISVGDDSWHVIEEQIIKAIEAKQNFFQGARVAIDVNNHDLKAADLGTLRDQLSERSVTLWAILTTSAITKETAKTYGLVTSIADPRTELQNQAAVHFDTALAGENAVMVQKTMRSGYRVSYPGHVVVIGDVNPGAEIIASGSVVVWGWLRGVVHAGAEGNEKAMVCALRLEPTQLRIASYIAITPKHKGKPIPEIAYIKNGQVIAEDWIEKEVR